MLNVHLNQLKLVEKRRFHPAYCYSTTPKPTEKDFISFDEFEDQERETFEHNDYHPPQPLMENGWCNIDERNILPNRRRGRYSDPP